MGIAEILRLGLTWGCLFSLYLVLAGQASLDEVVAGGVIAAVATALSFAVRRASGRTFRLEWAGVPGAVLKAVAAVPQEVVMVAVRLLSPHPKGTTETEPLSEHRDQAAGHAVQILSTSFAPNRYVISPVGGSRLLLHRLAGRSGKSQ